MIMLCSGINVGPVLIVAGMKGRGEVRLDIGREINSCSGGWLSFLLNTRDE